MNWISSIGQYIQGDKYLWAFIGLLAIFSFLPVYSASSNLVHTVGTGSITSHLGKHAFFLIVGMAIILVLQQFDYKYFGGFALLGMPIVIVLLVLTLLTGKEIAGANASRWLEIPGTGLTFQTSTIASITLFIYMARYLTKKRNERITFKESFLPLMMPILLVVGLIFPANGSTALIIFVLAMIMLFLGGYPIKYLIIFGLTGIFAAGLFIMAVIKFGDQFPNSRVDTWKNRVETFIEGDAVNEYYQVKHAKAAIYHGGLQGKGVGHSAFKQTLPQSSSDFIFAIIVEEYGAIGAILLIFIFLLILFRMVVIATKIHTYFGTLLVFACGLPIVFQSFTNMAVAVNLIPVTGQPLPMISYGGTALWVTCIAFGIILSVSKQIKDPEEIEAEKNKHSETYIQDIA